MTFPREAGLYAPGAIHDKLALIPASPGGGNQLGARPSNGHGALQMKVLLVIVAATMLVAAPGPALACSCTWGGPFTKVALDADLVLLGEVRSHGGHSVDVAVIEVLRGNEARQTIASGATMAPSAGPMWPPSGKVRAGSSP